RVLLSTPGAASDLAVHPLPSEDDYAAAIFDTLEAELDVDELPLVQFETGGAHVPNPALLLLALRAGGNAPPAPTRPRPGAVARGGRALCRGRRLDDDVRLARDDARRPSRRPRGGAVAGAGRRAHRRGRSDVRLRLDRRGHSTRRRRPGRRPRAPAPGRILR